MLRRRIDGSVGVVQLVGLCHGFEPSQPDPQFGRVSYTQLEALYGQQRGRKVWYLILDETFPTDPRESEPEELAKLQAAYRQRLLDSGKIYHPIRSVDALKAAALGLRNDLESLRRRGKRWAGLVVVLLITIAAIVVWMTEAQNRQTGAISALAEKQEHQTGGLEKVIGQQDKLLQVTRELAKTLAVQHASERSENEEAPLARAYATLEKKHGLAPGTLQRELPRFAAELIARPDAPALDKANALFVQKNFSEAESTALRVKEAVLAAAPKAVGDAINAFELAGWSAEAQQQLGRALDHFNAASALTSRARDPMEWVRVQHSIGDVLYKQGRPRESEAVLREVLIENEKALGADDPKTARSRNDLANSMQARGSYVEAEELHRAVLATFQHTLGPEHPDTLKSQNNLGRVLNEQGRFTEAEKVFREVLDCRKRLLGLKHHETLGTWGLLAQAISGSGRQTEAEQEYRAILKIEEAVDGAEHPDTLATRNNLAAMLSEHKKHADSENEHRAVLAIRRRVLGARHPSTLTSQMNVASALHYQARYAEAEKEYRMAAESLSDVLGPTHPDTLAARSGLAAVLNRRGNHGAAEEENRSILALQERELGPAHPDVLLSCYNLAWALEAQKKLGDALAFAKRAEHGRTTIWETEHPDSKKAKRLRERIETRGKLRWDLIGAAGFSCGLLWVITRRFARTLTGSVFRRNERHL